VILSLVNFNSEVLEGKNVYWISNPKHLGQNFNELGDMRSEAMSSNRPRLRNKISCGNRVDDNFNFLIEIKNLEIVDPSQNNVAFAVYFSVHTNEGHAILPIWYEDSYIHILPQESINTSMSIPRTSFDGNIGIYLKIEGWNIFSQQRYYLKTCGRSQ
jgi:hypothetical protein